MLVIQSKPIRLAEIVASLSIATDLGMGQPLEFALQSCVLSLRLGEALHYSDELLREIYFQSLLRYIGCNVETALLASVVGDEFALRSDFAMIDNGKIQDVVQLMLRYIRQVNQGSSPLQFIQGMLHGMLTLPQIQGSFAGHCEVAQRLAQRLGLESNIIYGLGQLYERWDGKGIPHGIKGEAVAPAVLVVTLCQDALIFYRLGGIESALKVIRDRKGAAYSPFMADCLCSRADLLFSDLPDEALWETVLELEPGTQRWLSEDEFDEACCAVADFVDLKSPATLGHSRQVAALAERAASAAGLPMSLQTEIRRAGWLHDVGKTGLSASILSKTETLSSREWEKVRLHPYYTERILSHSPSLSTIRVLASMHHECLDGSGYYRGLAAVALSPAARLIAAANKYCALLEDRPYRAGYTPEEAVRVLKREIHDGRLDSNAVNAVLAVGGHPVVLQDTTAGLSEREIEVLRLLAKGFSTKAIAQALIISAKTADHHIQHIYQKIGVSTRAGATLFAVEHQILSGITK